MRGWLDYLKLLAKSKTGISSGVVVWALVGLVCALVTLVFLIVAAFIWLAERYDALTAALAMGGFFLLITIAALVGCNWSHRRTTERAQLAIAARSNALWRDPKFMAAGLEIGRAVGWRRLVPLFAIGLLAAGLAREWAGGDAGVKGHDREEDEREAA